MSTELGRELHRIITRAPSIWAKVQEKHKKNWEDDAQEFKKIVEKELGVR